MFSDIPAGKGKIANLFYCVGTGRDDRGRVEREGNEAAWKDKGREEKSGDREEKKWGGGDGRRGKAEGEGRKVLGVGGEKEEGGRVVERWEGEEEYSMVVRAQTVKY